MKKQTCELELKKTYLLDWRKALEKKDVRSFNKLCVLHNTRMLDWLASWDLTGPLIRWDREILRALKQLIAPDQVIKFNLKFQDLTHPLVTLQSTDVFQNKTYNFVNPRLLDSSFKQGQQTMLFSMLMVIVFSRKRLVQH